MMRLFYFTLLRYCLAPGCRHTPTPNKAGRSTASHTVQYPSHAILVTLTPLFRSKTPSKRSISRIDARDQPYVPGIHLQDMLSAMGLYPPSIPDPAIYWHLLKADQHFCYLISCYLISWHLISRSDQTIVWGCQTYPWSLQ
jgi:hypothetical protein